MLFTTLLASPAITTITRSFVPQSILIDAVDTDIPLSDLSVSIGGKNTIKVTNASHIRALAKFLMESLLGVDVKIGMRIPIATGFMPNQSLQIDLTNSGATTPNIYGYSDSKDGRPVLAAQQTIQANSMWRL